MKLGLGSPARRWWLGAIWRFRRATWRSRALPHFLVIGAQKSGTTSLHSYLSQHPQLAPAVDKELHYFDGALAPVAKNRATGTAWYQAHFPLRMQLGRDRKTFEATPMYLFNPLVPRRIFELVPEAKLIVLLRNPTERAISHYFHTKRRGFESLPPQEALRAEEERLAPAIAAKDYANDSFRRHSYKSRGHYRSQLERFMEHFPRRQILIIKSETFFAETDTALERVFRFLEVDAGFRIEDLGARQVARKRGTLDRETYDYLDSYFRPLNRALYELLDDDYGW